MSQLINFRQTRLRELLGMIGNTANEAGNSVLSKIDAELAKLFEDRNVLLTDGGLITFTGTQLQFTEALKLTLNQKISGAAPQVIDLAATTRTLSATGRMIYAVIDRGAGTATVTDDATTLPAAVAANQEVFLIAKRVDATDGTQRLYFRNGMALNAGQTVRLGASGSGSGGDGVLNPISGYQWLELDTFDVLTASADSKVTGANYTNATQNIGKSLYRMLCDKSKTVATNSGTALTINLAPTFTVAIGDVAYITSGARAGQWRRISAVGSQTSFTLDSAFSGGDASAADTLMISQAVWTKDLVNYGSASEKTRARDFFSGDISQVAIDYFDSLVVDDDIPDLVDTARVVVSASNSGVVADSGVPASNLFGTPFTRVAYPGQIDDYILSANSTQERLHLVFFCNPSNGSVTSTANLLRYECNLYAESTITNGGSLNSAYCFSDGSGTEINCLAPFLVASKTRVQTNWSYVPNVKPGETKGQLSVFVDGLEIPRFVSGSTLDAFYKEVQNPVTGVYDTIELHADLSGSNLSIEIIKSEGIVDTNNQNTADIAAINSNIDSLFDAGFQDFIETSYLTAINGAPSSTQFRTFGISNRSSIPNLSNDLNTSIATSRFPIQYAYEIKTEVGPSNERVFGVSNDSKNQVRFVGTVTNQFTNNGTYVNISSANDFMEVVFYGTGLNVLFAFQDGSRDLRVTIDGGAESGNIWFNSGSGGSAFLNARGYSPNFLLPIASGLSEGLHTIRIRNTGGNNFGFSGYEILNEATTLKINSGAAYIDGKRASVSAQTPAYGSGFTNVYGSAGVKGGRVLVYMDSVGIKKDVRYVESSQLNLTSANHDNEEMVRNHTFREFGASRSDDWSTLSGSGTNRNYVLDDGSTMLTANSTVSVGTGSGIEGFAISTSSSWWITFVGTGLDILLVADGTSRQFDSVQIDHGTTIGTISKTSNTAPEIRKVVSGLPYGTHSVRFSTSGSIGCIVAGLYIYQPKKPTLPANSIELADYCLSADFVANTIGSPSSVFDAISTGVIRKYAQKEFTFVGAWSIGSVDATFLNGYSVSSSTAGNYVEYTFVGTGFDFRAFYSTAGTGNIQLTLDGSTNFSGFVTSHAGPAGTGFTAATGLIDGSASAGSGFGSTTVSNLSYGKHTIRATISTTGMNFCALDIISPVHSRKSDLSLDLQNTLSVGNCSVSDNRKFSPIKDLSDAKMSSSAVGVVSSPTTTSTSFVPMPDMSVSVKTKQCKLYVHFSVSWFTSAGNGMTLGIYLNGALVSQELLTENVSGGSVHAAHIQSLIPVNEGFHKLEIMWRSSSGATLTARTTNRMLTVLEI